MIIEKGDRIYNGLSSKLMNDIYDNLVSRYGLVENLQRDCCHWDIFSLYLARACNAIERSYHNNAKKKKRNKQ